MLTLDEALLARNCAAFVNHEKPAGLCIYPDRAEIAVMQYVLAKRLKLDQEPAIGDMFSVDTESHVTHWSADDIEATTVVYRAKHAATVDRALKYVDLGGAVCRVFPEFNDVLKFSVTAVALGIKQLMIYIHRWRYEQEDVDEEQRARLAAACIVPKYDLIDLVIVRTINAITGALSESRFLTTELPSIGGVESYAETLLRNRDYRTGKHCAKCRAVAVCPAVFSLVKERSWPR